MRAPLTSYQQVGQQVLRDRLITDHIPLVRHVMGRIGAELPGGIDRENLEAAGVLGLVEAAGSFDPQRGVPFSAFAYNRIRGAILDELRRNCPLPQQILQLWARIREAAQRLSGPATVEALSEKTGLSMEEVERCLTTVRLSRLDSWEDGFDSCANMDSEHDGTQLLDRTEQLRLIADAIEKLPTTMRAAITLYYRDELRMKEIGEVLGLSESRVSRVIAAAELRLKSLLRSHLEDGCNDRP